jgi:hypothetical protein
MAKDEGRDWARQLLIGLAALVVASVLVGVVVGVATIGATRVVGLGDGAGSGPSEKPSLYWPTGSPSSSPTSAAASATSASGSGSPSPAASSSPASPKPKPSPHKAPRPITLTAAPTTVAPSQRINLTGAYPGGDGATLQVQRFEGSWVDFPVTVTVHGDLFATYIETARAGKARFRVLDTASGRSSNPVTVTIG